MPIRIKYKPPPSGRDFSPAAGPPQQFYDLELPQIGPDDSFREIVRKLSMLVTWE